jgi:hypothetical protein
MVRGETTVLRIYSDPPGAIVRLPDGRELITPAEAELSRKTAGVITIKKEGYKNKIVIIQSVPSVGGFAFGGLYDYHSGATHNLSPNPVVVTLTPIEEVKGSNEEPNREP